ncbi:Predicted arabinose efflux permease, MFS family [Desulfonatronum thiosulfatophilum]|uniref:Predicted arabinose efflux permease, MFS family n=1 Tax=Desulfonatronum thiosulfatophilum TaxID=617002 RepID=A0A1G6DBE1_9BACT|nr:MFS transporter [Desulfonatronum thiosulfatophilum]SDB42448.1 Predicted arabinose efflux permease, MFS family [Desulfonatronum thiosulfatophilum]
MNPNPTPTRPIRATARLADFLALHPGTVGILAMVVLVGMGERMAERFLPIYILALGGSALAVGLLQAMDNLLSALYSFPGGYLSDRIGAKRSLLIFNLVAMAGYALVILIPTWQAVLIGAVLFISWSAISMPATMSLMYTVLPQGKRTMGVTMHSLVRRIPMALGPILGGIFIAAWGETDGIRLAFVAALVLAGAALVLQQRMIPDRPPAPTTTADRCPLTPEKNPIRLYRRMPAAMKGLLVSDVLIRFCEQIPYAFVVVWSMQVIAEPVSAVQFGVLTSIEMATAMLVYIPVAYMADRTVKKPFITATFVFFTLFPLVLMYSQSFSWLVGAFVLRGLKEFGEPTRKSLIMDLAPEDCRAGMFGLYYLIRDVFVSVAALGGAFLWMISPQVNLWTAFAFGVVGTLGFVLFGRETSRTAL